eukprot:jgi/Tetstr1/449247/TSEL_036452.t1
MALPIAGPLYAVLTPFRADREIDFTALRAHLRFLEAAGVKHIIVNGTTGEFPSLSLAERRAVLEFCREHWPGTLINHVSACALPDVKELLRHTEECVHGRPRADAVLILPPFYFAGALATGVEAFLRDCLSATRLPAFLYHFPAHVQQSVTPDMYARLAGECANLVGIKDSGGDLQASKALKAACPHLQVFVGNDRAASEVLRSGLDGSVTGAGNAVPATFVRIHAAFLAGDAEGMAKYQALLDAWAEFREGITPLEPPIVKAGVAALVPGYPSNVRPPFSQLPEEGQRRVEAWMAANYAPLLATPAE